MNTVIGLFDSLADARGAQHDLIGSGLSADRMSIVTRPPSALTGDRTEAAEGAAIGASTGAIAGGAAGLLASLGTLVIPGIGPILAAGSIAAILAGAGVGAAAGGIIGGLIGMGIPADEAEIYAEGIRRGGTLLSVDVTDNDADRVAAVLSQHYAVDIEKRAMEWETAGWQRQHARSTAASAPTNPPATPTPIPGGEPRTRAAERAPESSATAGSASQSSRRPGARVYHPQ